jgi:hypothetical protein
MGAVSALPSAGAFLGRPALAEREREAVRRCCALVPDRLERQALGRREAQREGIVAHPRFPLAELPISGGAYWRGGGP